MEQYLGLSLVTAICFQFPYADTISTVKYDSISSVCLASSLCHRRISIYKHFPVFIIRNVTYNISLSKRKSNFRSSFNRRDAADFIYINASP